MAIDLVNVAAGVGGFVIHGQDANDASGWSVSSAGDVNGDGFDDLIIGAKSRWMAPSTHAAFAGDSYVVFGKASGFAAEVDLTVVAAGAGGFVHPWPGRARFLRLVGVLGRRHQRRWLRRPHHRSHEWRWPQQYP